MHVAALTGGALQTPLGEDLAQIVGRLLAGERAARCDPRWPAGQVGAVVAPVSAEPAPSRHRRFLSPMGLMAVELGVRACAEARLARGERLGLFTAVGGLLPRWDEVMPAMVEQRLDGAGSWARGLGRLHPFWLLQYLSNNVQALLAADIDARGEGAAFGGANAGAQALVAAIGALSERAIDAALVVAYDSLLDPARLLDLSARGERTQVGLAALVAPYAAAAAGYVPGEAAAAVVLERAADAGSRARAMVSAAEGADGEPDQPRGAVLAAVLERLADGATVVDGAARATPALDADERAIVAARLPGAALTATASAMGEVGAAKPLVQIVVLAELLRRGQLPPIAGLQQPAPGPLALLTAVAPTDARVAVGLVTGAPGLAGAVRVERAGGV